MNTNQIIEVNGTNKRIRMVAKDSDCIFLSLEDLRDWSEMTLVADVDEVDEETGQLVWRDEETQCVVEVVV